MIESDDDCPYQVALTTVIGTRTVPTTGRKSPEGQAGVQTDPIATAPS